MPLYQSIQASRLTYAALIADPFADREAVATAVFNGLNNVDRLAFGCHTSMRHDLRLALAEPKEADMVAIFAQAGKSLPGAPSTDTEPSDHRDSTIDGIPDRLLVLVPLVALLLTSCKAEAMTGPRCIMLTLLVALICAIAGGLSWLTDRRD